MSGTPRQPFECDERARAVYNKIKASGALPSPTGVALRILKLTQDENVTIEAMTAAVESDPAIASRLVKLVNSPLAGTSRQIASVSRAVALLGVRTVTALALGFSLVANHRQGPCSAFDYDLFWPESLAQAVGARHLTARLGGFAPDEAFTCGLLSQIGRLAFATAYPERYAELLGTVSHENRRQLAEAENAAFDIDHHALAAEMMADWHIPQVFREAVHAQNDPDAGRLEIGSRAHLFARVLRLSGAIARLLPRSAVHRETLSTLVVQANRLGIMPNVYHEVFDAISREWREAGAIFVVGTHRGTPLAEICAQARDLQGVLYGKGPESFTEKAWGGESDARG